MYLFIFFIVFYSIQSWLGWPWWSILTIFPIAIIFGSIRQTKYGTLLFKKVECEKEPIDFDSLPEVLKNNFSEKENFLISQGFALSSQELRYYATNLFGKEDVKSLVRGYLHPGSKLRCGISFSFSWNPLRKICRTVSVGCAFTTVGKDKVYVTTNTSQLSPEISGEGLYLRSVPENNMSELLRDHQEWTRAVDAQDVNAVDSNVLSDRIFAVQMTEGVKKGLLVEDRAAQGYRYSWKGTLLAFKRFYQNRYFGNGKKAEFKNFYWKIYADKTVPQSETDEWIGSRTAVFHLTTASAFFQRFFGAFRGPLFWFLLLVSFSFSAGSATVLWGKFNLLELVGCLSGLYLTFCSLALFVAVLGSIFPVNGRSSEKFGRRSFKFGDGVICCETPLGITTCSKGQFPVVWSIGKHSWVQVPGTGHFVVSSKSFEKDGYIVFMEEMGKRGLVRSLQRVRWALSFALLISVSVLAYGAWQISYTRFYTDKRAECVYDKDKATLVLYSVDTYTKAPFIERWWTPSLYFSWREQADNNITLFKARVINLRPDGITDRTFQCLGSWLSNLVPFNGQVYAVVNGYDRKNYQDQKNVYLFSSPQVEKVSEAVQAQVLSRVTGTNSVMFPEGWKALGSEADQLEAGKLLNVPLSKGYEFVESIPQREKGKYKGIVFQVLKDGKTVLSDAGEESDTYQIVLTREEFEKETEVDDPGRGK